MLDKNLVVLGCTATKVETDGVLPAIHRYDGPAFRVLRTFLRGNRWPDSLSIAVLLAKYGLIGGLAHIPNYNRRMTGACDQTQCIRYCFFSETGGKPQQCRTRDGQGLSW
jgi:hypothetical protein